MRLIKDYDADIVPFHESIQKMVHKNSSVKGLPNEGIKFSAARNVSEQMNYYFKMFLSAKKELEETATAADVIKNFRSLLKKIIPLKLANIFYLDENLSALYPAMGEDNLDFIEQMNYLYHNGMLDWMFSTGKPHLIPDSKQRISEDMKLNFLIFPLIEESKRKGILSIYTTVKDNELNETDVQAIEILLSLYEEKMDQLLNKEKIKSLVLDLQTYQAKLTNENRFFAIGQFTDGIVEDILNPLQVIISNIGLMENKVGKQNAEKIKLQVSKIKQVIDRLVKFASIEEGNPEIVPCDLNQVINDFYNVIGVTLKNSGIEGLLDLDKNLPPILSNKSVLNQILSNVFTFIKPEQAGGILIQTKNGNDYIILKMISTKVVNIEEDDVDNAKDGIAINLRILKNIMKKSEGQLFLDSFDGNGTGIILHFPIRRKVR